LIEIKDTMKAQHGTVPQIHAVQRPAAKDLVPKAWCQKPGELTLNSTRLAWPREPLVGTGRAWHRTTLRDEIVHATAPSGEWLRRQSRPGK